MIMIDTSGSTAGQTLYLMALTVQKLLNTLGEDDFFHVATVSVIFWLNVEFHRNSVKLMTMISDTIE